MRCCLKEVQSKDAGRRTGTGSEVWHDRDELARDSKVLHPHRVMLYKSVPTLRESKVYVSYPGRSAICRCQPLATDCTAEARAIVPDRMAEVSRGHSRYEKLVWYGRDIVAPPGNQAANREDKVQPEANQELILKARTVPQRD